MSSTNRSLAGLASTPTTTPRAYDRRRRTTSAPKSWSIQITVVVVEARRREHDAAPRSAFSRVVDALEGDDERSSGAAASADDRAAARDR